MTDETQMNEVQAEAEPVAVEPETTEYIEFVGWKPYGTEFTAEHSISGKHMQDTHDIKMTGKDLVWRKGANGRMLLPLDSINPEVAEYLETDEAFKKVSL